MKFIDLIKEPSDDKLLKKAKTIFSALRRGKITRKDGVSFSYELGGRTFARVHEGEIELVGSVISIKENTYCPINERYMTELIENKFKMFGINVELRPPTEDQIEKWTGRKPWEEPLNEEIDEYTQKQIKKAKTIYRALKKGTIGGNDPEQPHFTYVLSDDFTVDTTNAGIVISLEKIKIKHLNRGCLLHSTDYMGSLIRKRFNLFGIILTNPYKDLYFDYEVDAWESPINEEEEDNDLTEKDRKKIELIYGLFKRGKYTVEDILYNYVLPEEYWTSNNKETGELIVVLTMDPTQKMKLYAKIKKEDGNLYHREVPVEATQYASLYDDAKKRIKEKFERFNIEIVF